MRNRMLRASLIMFALAFAGLLAYNAYGQAAIQNLSLGDNVSASASSTLSSDPTKDFSPAGAIDGDRTGNNWEHGGGWNDATRDGYPDTLTVSLPSGRKAAVSRVVIYSLVDTFPSVHEPTNTETCNSYGLVDFTVDALDSTGNVLATAPAVTGNTLCRREVVFSSVVANVSSIRLNVTNANSHYSRVVEMEWLPR